MPDTQSPREPLARAMTHALAYLDKLDTASVSATATLDQLRSRLGRPLAEDGVDASRVIDDLVADVDGGLIGSAGGRFFAWVIGGAVPAALAADWLTSTWDQNAGMYAAAPAAAVVEEACGQWLLELLGLPRTCSFALVTGCQMAHVTCLAAARNAVLARRGWDVEADGVPGAPLIRVVAEDQRHGSVDRALRMLGVGRRSVARPLRVLGLGRASLVEVAVGDDGHLPEAVLAGALASGPDLPTIVI